MTEYEFVDLRIPRGTTRHAVVRLLTEHAEYGRWELARLRLTPTGERMVRLRRKVMRVQRTA